MQRALLLFALLLPCGCTPASPDVLAPVDAYLTAHIVEANFGGQVFCAYDVLGMEIRLNEGDVYVWALCAEYYPGDGRLQIGSAASLPVALSMVMDANGNFVVAGHHRPGEGSAYGTSIRQIFPPEVIRAMCEGETGCYNERAWRLEEDTAAQAQTFFGQR